MVGLNNMISIECSTLAGYCKEAGISMDRNRFETVAFPFAKPVVCLSPQGFHFLFYFFPPVLLNYWFRQQNQSISDF